MNIVRSLFHLVLTGHYQITDHAIESLDEDGLSMRDIVCCLATGVLRRKWPRQRKYEVDGRGIDGRPIRVVLRLLTTSLARIITVYEIR